MADGFRKAFLGFNCNDVIEYVKKTHKEFGEKEESYTIKIAELETKLSDEQKKTEELVSELDNANAVIEEYKKKEDEINRISENIGKLYLVSEANARAVTKTAEDNRRLADEEIRKNLEILKTAHEQISAIIKGVTDTTVDFTDSMKSLNNDLEATVEVIEENNQKSDDIIKESKSILSPAE